MNLDWLELLQRFALLVPSLTLHEFGHAWVATRCGDPTPEAAARLTLNPLAHLDPIGTLCILFAPIGWAKPVPVNPANFRNPRRDDILVSLAGITMNVLLAIVCAAVFRFFPASVEEGSRMHVYANLVLLAVGMNVGLAVFNLIPLYPLDGSHVLKNLLPYEARMRFEQMQRFAPLVLLGVIIFGRDLIGQVILAIMVFLLTV